MGIYFFPMNLETPILSVDEDASVSDRLTANAEHNILPARYLRKDSNGEVIETPAEMFERVAENVAQAEDNYDYASYDNKEGWQQRFEDAMKELRFMPNSPTLMNAGTEMNQLSACFVEEPKDDMESIFDKAKQAALIFQSGGGVGYPFHHIRPKGSHISSTGGEASGPVSFMRVFDETCNQVKQGGCIDASTRVMTDDGYKPLSSVHDAPPLRDSHGANRLVQGPEGNLNQVVESSDSSTMPASLLTTESGHQLTATPNHPILAVQEGKLEFTPVEELSKGDVVVLDSTDATTNKRTSLDGIEGNTHDNATQLDLPQYLTDDVARMLGTLWADGCYDSSNNRLVFTFGKDGNADKDALDFIKRFFNSVGIEVYIQDEEERDKGEAWRVVANSKRLMEWFEKNGLAKDKDNLANLPEALYESPASIPSFLGGMTCDATIHSDGGRPRYSTADADFAKEIQELLLLIGVPARRFSIEAREDRFSDKPRYEVVVFGGEYSERFDNRVPHYLNGNFSVGGGRQNQLPDAEIVVSEILSDHYEKGKKLPESVDRASMKELRRYSRGDRTPSLYRTRELLRDVDIDPDEYEILDETNLFQRIEGIEDAGQPPVYDIEVMDGPHEFVASNFVVHNKRRGAQMAILRVDHPDIGRFITSKRTEGELDNFNISAGVTDDFLNAVKHGEEYEFGDPTDDYESGFEALEATAHFYDPSYQDNPENAFDTGEGDTVDANLWRDHADTIRVPLDDETITLREKWEDKISVEEGEQFTLPAEFIWDIMVDGAWQNGEPGLFYYDWTRDDDTYPDSDIEATNPCAEQPLSEHEACNLGHINLSLMVDDDAPTLDEYRYSNSAFASRETMAKSYVEKALDLESFHRTTRTAYRFLENVVDQSDFPLDEIEQTVDTKRKVGVGIMGMAQMLYQMGIPYDSEAGRDISAEVMRRIQRITTEESHELAEKRGSFGNYEESKWAEPMEHPDWFRRHTGGIDPLRYEDGYPVRNHNQTTIAPTGTTSMIGDTSGGCEPVYSVAYYKNVGGDIQGDDMLVEFDSYFLQTLTESGINKELVKREASEQMMNDNWDGIKGLETVPDSFGDVFVTTEQITPEDHTRMQHHLQKWIDSGISKTINLPNESTRADVASAYMLSLSHDTIGKPAKGTTVYRDGSRNEQVKSTSGDMSEAGAEDEAPDPIELYQSDEWSDEEVEQFIEEVTADTEETRLQE